MKRSRTSFAALLLLCAASVTAQLQLPRLISDGMVLQREVPLKIWGWTEKNREVSLHFLGKEYSTSADTAGKWMIHLPSQKTGGPFTMTISSGDTIELTNILLGDVWICSGQSNMELPMRRVSWVYPEVIASSENTNIRQFYVPRRSDLNRVFDNLESGSWKSANPSDVLDFSATAYFFARSLYDQYKVPVGIINTALGGSPAEAWLSEEALKQFPSYYQDMLKFRNKEMVSKLEKESGMRSLYWYRELAEKDEGYKQPGTSLRDPAFDDADWQTFKVPGFWKEAPLKGMNGVVWFRKDINVPASMTGKKALLILGRLVDADSVFVNGVFAGSTSYQYPPRRYELSSGLLKEGRNTIVVRLISNAGMGGFVPDKPYELVAGEESISLEGEWKYRIGAVMPPLIGGVNVRMKPGGLYNCMIHPLLNYSIKGAIWYQGESNADRWQDYRQLLSALITDWRRNWNQGDLPFLFVQLPNFMEVNEEPSNSNWAHLREAQLKTLAVPNTAMAVAIDVGEWNDIHPLHKKEVGERLALAARSMAYGETKLLSFGPVYEKMKAKKGKIILEFSHCGSGLKMGPGKAKGSFAIAGADKKFVWAEYKLEKGRVIVWCEQLEKPVAVRYAWADNPGGALLYNLEGLPASPFRTDGWE
ncbi:MAG: sialate O-acetylesterase [Bacteroidales bacterium]